MIDPIPFVIVGMNVLVALSVAVVMLLSANPPGEDALRKPSGAEPEPGMGPSASRLGRREA